MQGNNDREVIVELIIKDVEQPDYIDDEVRSHNRCQAIPG